MRNALTGVLLVNLLFLSLINHEYNLPHQEQCNCPSNNNKGNQNTTFSIKREIIGNVWNFECFIKE
jgi:hypothetical protein